MYVYVYIFAYVYILYTCAATLGMHIVVFEKSWQMSLYTSPTLRNTKRVCCSVLQCVAACCIVRQCDGVAMCGRCHHTLLPPCAPHSECVAVCCSVSQSVAVSVLHCVVVCNSVACCSVLQCSILQCVADVTVYFPHPAHPRHDQKKIYCSVCCSAAISGYFSRT